MAYTEIVPINNLSELEEFLATTNDELALISSNVNLAFVSLQRFSRAGRLMCAFSDVITGIDTAPRKLSRVLFVGLDLSNNDMIDVVERLPHIVDLNLSWNNIGETGAMAIAKHLPTLTSLNLWNNSIGEAGAKAIAEHLPALTSLNLWSNNIGEIGAKAIAKRLTELKSLNLFDNNIGETGAKAIAERLRHIVDLNLSNNSIGEVGAHAIAENLTALKSLDLANNSIGEAGARAIANAEHLTALTSLNLASNSIGDAGAHAIAEHLTALTSLNLANNNIGDVGARAIAENLTALKSLDLYQNSIGKFGGEYLLDAYYGQALSFLKVERNPFTEKLLTPEVFFTSDARSILAAWKSFRDAESEGRLQPLNEAKLIVVGNAEVGKTSLIRFLTQNIPCDPNEKRTPGIQQHERIETQSWHPEGSAIKLNVWDFGGQEIMHGTHRYFLTARSLYLLVLEDCCKDDPPVKRWMRIIQSVAGDAPVLVIINKSDKGKEALKLDKTDLHRDFPQIVRFLRTSCEDDDWSRDSIASLRSKIAEILRDHEALAHIRTPIPGSWIAIKDAIRERTGAETLLALSDFQRICIDPTIVGDEPIVDPDMQRALLRQLHELGIIVAHGLERDSPAALKEITLLDPNWLTDAIYSVLNSAKLRETGGRFSLVDLQDWLEPAKYPIERHEFVLSMMKHPDISLCFRLPGDEEYYLAPEALPQNSPDFTGWADGALRFRFRYSYLPRALMPRFIVLMNNSLMSATDAWRNGARLRVNGADVLVISDRDRHVIDIAIKGNSCQEILAVVRYAFSQIHSFFTDLDMEEWVPMPDDPDVEERYSHLKLLESEEGPDYEHRPSGAKHRYTVRKLLQNIDSKEPQIQEPTLSSEGILDKSRKIFSAVTTYPIVAAIFGLLICRNEFGLNWLRSGLVAVMVYAAVRFAMRLFDRGFMFRRMFFTWITGGIALLVTSSIAISIKTDPFSFNYGGYPTLSVVAIWVFGTLTLAGFAWWEAKKSNST